MQAAAVVTTTSESKKMSCNGQTSNAAQCAQARLGEGEEAVREAMKQYYGQELKSKEDCQTNVNCRKMSCMPPHVRDALKEVHEEVANKYYGCGLVIPEALEGCAILDLGCGTGQDCFAISKLVGSKGHVVGVDMTEEQLAIAKKYVDYHADKFGYSQPNVDFVLGQIEKLCEAGVKQNAFDIVISNCVINLCPDKESVLKEAFRVLREGGEIYFSDMYTDTDLSPDIRQHRLLWGEGMGGAWLLKDLYRLAQQIGFSQPRLVTTAPVDVSKFSDILGKANFVSGTYRLFKLPGGPQSACLVTYKGGIVGCAEEFKLDYFTTFKKNEALAVDGELAAILSSSRFRQFFSFDKSGPVTPVTSDPKVDPFKIAAAKAL